MPESYIQTEQIDKLLDGLRNLQQFDNFVDVQEVQARKKSGWWWTGFVISFILGFILAIATANISGFAILLILDILAGIVCLIFGILWSVKTSKWTKQNVENRRIEIPLRFLAVIGRDIPKKRRCHLQVSFEGYLKHGQLVEEQKGGWLNPVSTFKYVDTWFAAIGRLCDGNKFRVTIEQTIHRKEKRKRKYTKVNQRFSEEVTLLLRVSPESYPNWPQLAAKLAPGQCDGMEITRVNVQNGAVRVTCRTGTALHISGRYGLNRSGDEQLATADTLLRLFLYVYGALQECRTAQTA